MGEATVKLTVAEWATVLDGLGELPYKIAAPIFNSIAGQVRGQMQAGSKAGEVKK